MSKVLLVDDDVDLAELVRTKLVSQGHEVVVVNTGEGAFEIAKRVKPDIALLDIMLPGITGYQICRKFRKDPELYTISILILTALGDEPEMMHGLDQGADDYVAKPFKLERLTEKIDYLVNLKKSLGNRNSVTNLPGMEAIKREINHRLARGIKMATCYIDLYGYKPYAAAKGREGQRKALELVSSLLVSVRNTIGIYETFIAHVGGASFAILLNSEDYQRYCDALMVDFDRESQSLYTPEEVSQNFLRAADRQGTEGNYPLMSLAIGVTHNENREFKNAANIFEVFTQIQQVNVPDGKSALFVDRRTAER
ncbi:MAG: response regulator [Candidatus Hydrogenedentota bacterium]